MSDLVSSVRGKLERTLNYLDRGNLYATTAERQAALRARAAELLSQLTGMEHMHLTVGLLGGTGVGKSSVINALAGAEISTASHRRPYTDRIIVYRHEAAPGPGLSGGDLPFSEVLHTLGSIRHILLCDLPDFDSIEERHRATVSAFLPGLDIAAWITTPEKYADERFYRSIEKTPRSPDNFLFVLNKVDLLFKNTESREGFERLAKITAGIVKNLSDIGINGPLIYSISASEALNEELSGWNQFTAFRNFLFKHRNAKTVTAIKTSNIEAAVSTLLNALKEERRVAEALLRAIRKITDKPKPFSTPACTPPARLVPSVFSSELHRRISSAGSDDDALTGPGYLIWLAAGYLKRPVLGKNDFTAQTCPEETISAFRRCLDWIFDRLQRQMIRENIPADLREQVVGILDRDKRVNLFKSRIEEFTTVEVEAARDSGYRLFRLRQRLCYGSAAILLFIVLGGQTAWLELLHEPKLLSLLELLLAFVTTLFSVKGLAALASYALISIFFGFRFFRHHQKSLNRRAKETEKALESALLTIWNSELEEIAKDLEEKAHGVLLQATAFSAENPPEQAQ